MPQTIEWRERKYQEVLEQELLGLERRRQHDPSFTRSDLLATLQHLYNMEGSDWVGRGDLQDLVLQATIAAYEQTSVKWEKEERDSD